MSSVYYWIAVILITINILLSLSVGNFHSTIGWICAILATTAANYSNRGEKL